MHMKQMQERDNRDKGQTQGQKRTEDRYCSRERDRYKEKRQMERKDRDI